MYLDVARKCAGSTIELAYLRGLRDRNEIAALVYPRCSSYIVTALKWSCSSQSAVALAKELGYEEMTFRYGP
jgi:hypothetical protein